MSARRADELAATRSPRALVPAFTVKILLLAHKLPWPLHDGYNLHNHNYVQQLHGDHEFHLVSLGTRAELPDGIADWFASVHCIPARKPPARSVPHRLTHAFDLEEFFDFDPAVAAAIDEVLAEHAIDVVWCSGAKMLVYSRRLGLPTLGDIADEAAKEALHDLRVAVRRPFDVLGLAQAGRTFWNTWRWQRSYLEHAAVCTVVSEADQATLARNCPDLHVDVVPNGVDAQRYAPMGREEVFPTLVFEGAMDFRPNVEGITAFFADTLPLIRAVRPDVRVVMVGKNPAPEVEALADPNSIVTGFVDDVRPWVDEASVFICPLRRGAGIKNKILQAWAMEKPVVATPVSCGGLKLRPGENIEVAETPETFAQAVLDLLDDPDRRSALGQAGRRTVMEHYSWEHAARTMEGILQGIAAGRPVAV